MAVQIGWRIRVAKEQTKCAREIIAAWDGKDAQPILETLDRALDQTQSARDTIDGLDGKDARPILLALDRAIAKTKLARTVVNHAREPVLGALDGALGDLREAEMAAIQLTKKLIAMGRLPDERGTQPDRRSPDSAA